MTSKFKVQVEQFHGKLYMDDKDHCTALPYIAIAILYHAYTINLCYYI